MRNNNRKWQQRVTVFLGIFLSLSMVLGLITPFLTNNSQHQQLQPTDVPVPTQPAPPDTANIHFDDTYLEPSGIFTAAIPSGYTVSREFNSTGESQVTMENPESLSILELRVIRPTAGTNLESASGLGEFFTREWLTPTWNRYSSWNEDARRVEEDKLIMDYSLKLGQQDYVARQIAFTDGTWIYSVRSIYPSNATEAMQYVLTNEVQSLQTIPRFVGAPLEWDGYYDHSDHHLIRVPDGWLVEDSADGAPASLMSDNARLRLETNATTIDSADAARTYVASLRSNAQVLSVEPVEQFDYSGFRVAYTVQTLDGESQSGLVLILNGTEQAHIANILLTDVADTDLNNVDLTAETTSQSIKDARAALDTFSIFPDLMVNAS